jgi:hypothetical protein
MTRPEDVHAAAGVILKFLEETTAISEEVAVAALKVAANTIDETAGANQQAAMRDAARNFFKRK